MLCENCKVEMADKIEEVRARGATGKPFLQVHFLKLLKNKKCLSLCPLGTKATGINFRGTTLIDR
jgi:hypothetical protein